MRILSFDIGTRTLSYCLVSVPSNGSTEEDGRWESVPKYTILAWESIDTLTENEVLGDGKQIRDHVPRVIASLRSRCASLLTPMPDCICIEQQRAGKFGNVTMMVMSYVLQAFFETHAHSIGQPANIDFMSPTLKLKVAEWIGTMNNSLSTSDDGAADDVTGETRHGRYVQYKTNKAKAKAACEFMLLAENPMAMLNASQKDAYLESKKRDDLADCFLQAVAYHRQKTEREPFQKAKARKSRVGGEVTKPRKRRVGDEVTKPKRAKKAKTLPLNIS